jgi:hypothetical protein
LNARQRTQVADCVGIGALVMICMTAVLSFTEMREIVAESFAAAARQVREGDRQDSGNPIQDLYRAKLEELDEAKRELVNSADLARIHHEVYAQIGEENWEEFAKPEFLQEIYLRTKEDTGSQAPTWKEVVAWVRENETEANTLLESYKTDPRFTNQ